MSVFLARRTVVYAPPIGVRRDYVIIAETPEAARPALLAKFHEIASDVELNCFYTDCTDLEGYLAQEANNYSLVELTEPGAYGLR